MVLESVWCWSLEEAGRKSAHSQDAFLLSLIRLSTLLNREWLMGLDGRWVAFGNSSIPVALPQTASLSHPQTVW